MRESAPPLPRARAEDVRPANESQPLSRDLPARVIARASAPLATSVLRRVLALSAALGSGAIVLSAPQFVRGMPLLVILFSALGLGAVALAAAFVPCTMTIGLEGLALEWLGQVRVMRHGRIRGLHLRSPSEVVIALMGGERHTFRFYDKAPDPRGFSNLLADRYETFRAAPPPDPASASLCLGERSVEDWASFLSSVARALSSTQVPVETEQSFTEANEGAAQKRARLENLIEVAHNPRTPDEVRYAAAAVLRMTEDAEANSALSRLAEAVASPKLAHALKLLCADGDPDEHMVEGLAMLNR